MAAQITMNICDFCHGSGKAERLMERTISDASYWVACHALSHEIADAWIATDPGAPIRWECCDCPKCSGHGKYEIENVACKIF